MNDATFAVIIGILVLPLLLNLPEARVVAPVLAALFLLGFTGPVVDSALKSPSWLMG
jgi:hypothetical protein